MEEYLRKHYRKGEIVSADLENGNIWFWVRDLDLDKPDDGPHGKPMFRLLPLDGLCLQDIKLELSFKKTVLYTTHANTCLVISN